jgi:hypothetical protein
MARNTEKREKWECTLSDLGYGEKLKNVKNDTQTLDDLEYGEKHSNTYKMRSAHCRTRNMGRKLKNVENEKQTLFELEYG